MLCYTPNCMLLYKIVFATFSCVIKQYEVCPHVQFLCSSVLLLSMYCYSLPPTPSLSHPLPLSHQQINTQLSQPHSRSGTDHLEISTAQHNTTFSLHISLEYNCFTVKKRKASAITSLQGCDFLVEFIIWHHGSVNKWRAASQISLIRL